MRRSFRRCFPRAFWLLLLLFLTSCQGTSLAPVSSVPDREPSIPFEEGYPPRIFTYVDYYLNGIYGSDSFYFYDDGSVDICRGKDYLYGEYEISTNGYVLIRVETDDWDAEEDEGDEESIPSDALSLSLAYFSERLPNFCTLLDEEGRLYSVEDAGLCLLETDEFYYLGADEEGASLYFWEDGDVEYQDATGECFSGTYSIVDTIKIVAEFEGWSKEYSILGYYILADFDIPELYLRIP